MNLHGQDAVATGATLKALSTERAAAAVGPPSLQLSLSPPASPEPLERGAAMSSRTARRLLERGECRLALSDRGKDLDDVG